MDKIKQKRFTKFLSEEDCFDITIMFEDNRIFKFSLNYRALIHDNWHEIYRVDNYHGFLHEQRYWQSTLPIPLKYLEERYTLDHLIDFFIEQIEKEFRNYRKYYIQYLRKN